MVKELNSEIVKGYGLEAGADAVGIAVATDFGLAPEGFKPSDNLEECRSVIVLGASFPPEALDNVPDYTAMRNAVLTKMTDIAKSVAKKIKADGYNVKAISAIGGKSVGDGRMNGHISLKHAAELAGLGFITKNYLLTNAQYGNRLWFSAVLTDAVLVPDEKVRYDICDNCSKCIDSCPVNALNDLNSFGRKSCSIFYKIVNKKLEIQCYKCRTVCPHCLGILSNE